ncbi:ATP-grasp domain-containing protein [Parapedobacter lycopersici]|uniref:ATP-grasp domain-containing protein n=1 Tax=Parapedobacter lycopersici TaxID=1864939 RepID=UPI00214D5564|nr:ATP-grasp domain-containing protein [Parapedobacter lycopersici]
MDKINIGVTGTGSLIGQAIIKSIIRSDLSGQITLIGFDYFGNTVGAFWCKRNYILPDILKSPVIEREWLAFVIRHLQDNDIRVLFVGVDFELPLFAKYKKAIEQETEAIVMVSSEDVIRIADDKYLTYQFLKDNSLYHPQSWLPSELKSAELHFPLIVKPRKGARSVGVSKVENEDQLNTAINAVKDPVIQECIGTEETEFTCGVIYLNNAVKKAIVLNRSLKAGNTFISRYSENFPQIITDYLIGAASVLKPFGACNFQLRIDKNGIPKIFEINGRHSGTTYIRSLFGFREVEYILNTLLFDRELDFELREGTVVRYYDEFFTSEK